jgi:hypothetical protein
MLILLFYIQYTISLGKGNKKSNISGDEMYFSADILSFYMINHFQKSSAPFRPFFGLFKENSAANFSGCTNFLGPLLSSAAEISAPWQHWTSV